jgi:hypothetical protein
MKSLKNLVNTDTLNLEELMMIKGAAADESGGCDQNACTKKACNTNACTGSACNSYACHSKSCNNTTCTSNGCFRMSDSNIISFEGTEPFGEVS